MRDDLTDITIVLDRSGSMESIRPATVNAVNEYIASQQTGPGECRLTLVQFDDQYQIDHAGVPIGEVPPLNNQTYQPRGTTALLDAIGRTIVANGGRFAAMDEADRPGLVIFVIQTDGLENASREFDLTRVNRMIAEHRDRWQWQFVFLGANQDAIATAASMGIARGSSMTYASTDSGVLHAMRATSARHSDARARRAAQLDPAPAFEYTEEDRRQAEGS